MKTHYLAMFLILICILMSHCRGERWDDDLTLPKQDYTGNQLRIDGYFYNDSDGRRAIYFFYRDGTVLFGGLASEDELIELEIAFTNGNYYEQIKDSKTDWGRFTVDGSSFKMENWIPSNGNPLEVYTFSGDILNDSTIQFKKSWRSCKPNKTENFEEIYYFKKFSPKPDSTNSFTN